MAEAEPERELIRRALPPALPAAALSYLLGHLGGGPGAGASAALAVALVGLNFAAAGISIGWAATISPTAVVAVGLGGFAIRLAVLFAAMALLDGLAWFSPLAFGLALVPATIALLAFEMRLVSGRMQADLWYFRERPS